MQSLIALARHPAARHAEPRGAAGGQAAGLTQAQMAIRMGLQASAAARLERALATGRHSPSIATLRKYVNPCGKSLVLRVA